MGARLRPAVVFSTEPAVVSSTDLQSSPKIKEDKLKAKHKLDTHPIPEIFLAQQAQREMHARVSLRGYFRKDREIRLREKVND